LFPLKKASPYLFLSLRREKTGIKTLNNKTIKQKPRKRQLNQFKFEILVIKMENLVNSQIKKCSYLINANKSKARNVICNNWYGQRINSIFPSIEQRISPVTLCVFSCIVRATHDSFINGN